MGMYTELIFEGVTKSNVPEDIKDLMMFFFDEADIPSAVPDHPLFKEDTRWRQLGGMSSCYHLPMAVKQSAPFLRDKLSLFMRCDLKNYDFEIDHFLNWIKPYMEWCRGWVWYEEWAEPELFNYHMLEGDQHDGIEN